MRRPRLPRGARRPYFNPRTHVGCDLRTSRKPVRTMISIHAPTWGATSIKQVLCDDYEISIHAPTWGATVANVAADLAAQFQSTHPRGVRPSRHISLVDTFYFNPRTHVGCDKKAAYFCRTRIFQSTHPRGVRLPLTVRLCGQLRFQSTHPRGVRPGRRARASTRQAFQSTHPRGVRLLSHQMVGF